MDTDPTLTLVPSPPARIDSPRKPDWAIILLGRVQHGDTIEQARQRKGSLVSTDTIHRYGRMDPDWLIALMDAQDGTVKGEPVGDLELARANAYEEEERRHSLAMEAGEKYAHPYMRLGAEKIGRLGQGAQAVAVQGVVINITVRPQSDLLPPRVIEGEAQNGAR